VVFDLPQEVIAAGLAQSLGDAIEGRALLLGGQGVDEHEGGGEIVQQGLARLLTGGAHAAAQPGGDRAHHRDAQHRQDHSVHVCSSLHR